MECVFGMAITRVAEIVVNWMVKKAAAPYNTEFRGEEVNDSTLLTQLIHNIIFCYNED